MTEETLSRIENRKVYELNLFGEGHPSFPALVFYKENELLKMPEDHIAIVMCHSTDQNSLELWYLPYSAIRSIDGALIEFESDILELFRRGRREYLFREVQSDRRIYDIAAEGGLFPRG